MQSGDTIVAISSAPGPAARVIVRLSGPDTHRLVDSISPQKTVDSARSSTARRANLIFADLKISAWIYQFRAPRSYSGEDMAELHIPGNPLLARMLLQDLISRGARAADAGEFTARAWFNGKMDLTEAEGIAATIHAHSEEELRRARQLAAGELSRRVRPAMDLIAETLALVEVGIDFSDEDVTFLSNEQIHDRLKEVDAMLTNLVDNSAQFERLTHEPAFVLVGRPNSGKSTLLNALSGQSRAVVSAQAGTTRDVLSAEVALESGIVRLLDAAGLEENLPDISDTSPTASIARQMHARARAALESADFVIRVQDVTDQRPPLILPRDPHLTAITKIDLLKTAPRDESHRVHVSAHQSPTLNVLRTRMEKFAFGHTGASASALNARHLQAISECCGAIERAMALLNNRSAEADPTADVDSPVPSELLAVELRDALEALGHVVGQVSPDELLGRIFAKFCIGK